MAMDPTVPLWEQWILLNIQEKEAPFIKQNNG